MDDLLIGRRSTDFPKNDAVADALHEDIIAFEKYVNAFNQEKKPMFDLLIEHIKEAVGEAVTGAEVIIYVYKKYIICFSAKSMGHSPQDWVFPGQISTLY